MKKNETKQETVEVVKDVEKPVVERKPWTRHVHTYYIYSEKDGFLLKDRTFGVTGELFTFDNLQTAKTIQQFFNGTKILTEA